MLTGDRLLARTIRFGGPWTIAYAGCSLAGAAAELLLPAALGRTVDGVLAPGARPWGWLAACVALVVVAAGSEIAGDLAAGVAGARATAKLRHLLVRHMLALHPAPAARYPAGDLVGRIVGQAPEAARSGPAAVQLVTAALPPVGSLVALVLIDPWLGVTFLAGLVALTALLRAFVADASDAATGYQRVQGDIAARLGEALAGARTIAAAGTEGREAARILALLPLLRGHGDRTWRVFARAAARGALLGPALQLAVVAVGGYALARGRVTPGELIAAVQYAALGAGLGAVVAVLNGLARTRAGARRAAQVLAEPLRQYGPDRLPVGAGRLELRGVTVDGVLNGIDLAVAPGEAVAVVGRSGAGKSVLAAVAGRLRDPDRGDVLLDGVPLRRLDHAALRRAVGAAFERPVLVGATIGDAIGLGHPEPTPAWVRHAAGVARVDTFVERLPDGYQTRLAEAPMSGGEAQRLGLARALAAERLLILDDATSSLDTVTEYQIGRALFGGAEGRTRLIVAHRAGTAARAHRVVWLDAGRIRAIGPHEDLWRDAAYRGLFQGDP